MLRKYAGIVAALIVCVPIGGGARVSMATYADQIHALRPAIRWSPGPIELVLLCSCLVVLSLIAPRLHSSPVRYRQDDAN